MIQQALSPCSLLTSAAHLNFLDVGLVKSRYFLCKVETFLKYRMSRISPDRACKLYPRLYYRQPHDSIRVNDLSFARLSKQWQAHMQHPGEVMRPGKRGVKALQVSTYYMSCTALGGKAWIQAQHPRKPGEEYY